MQYFVQTETGYLIPRAVQCILRRRGAILNIVIISGLTPGNRLLYISLECDEICQVGPSQCFDSAALQLSGFNIRTEEEVVVSAANYRYSAEIFNDDGADGFRIIFAARLSEDGDNVPVMCDV